MYLENARNPLTGQTLDQKTLRRLYEQYKNWRERYKSDLMNVDGVVLTQEDVEEYKDGMEKMEIQMRKAGVSPTAEQVAHAYTSDLLELDEDDEKSKALYKLITEKDFSQDK